MNKLIDELAGKANAWYPEGYPSSEGGDAAWMNLVIFDKEDLKKFAESIIRECTGVVEGGSFLHEQAPTAVFARECSSAIKRHFGVDK